MKPTILTLPAFHVVGLEGTFTPETIPQLPELWGRFVPQKLAIPGRKGDVTFGFSRPNVAGPDGTRVFLYTAAVEVEDLDRVPEGLVGFTVPASTYARFTHTGPIADIGKTIDSIWTSWIPASGLEPTHGPEFERYDHRWDARTGTGPVDLYIPVRAVDVEPTRVRAPQGGVRWGVQREVTTSEATHGRVTLVGAPAGVVPLCPHCKAALDTIWSLVEGLGFFGQERILLCPHCRSFLAYSAWKR